jgi:hypothetical protein
LGRLGPNLPNVLVQQILEFRAAPLESSRIDVGKIIRYDGHPRLLCIQPGLRNP